MAARTIWLVFCSNLMLHVTLWPFFQQENAPYSKGAFKIEINFPAEYPFKPPKVSLSIS